MAVLPAAMTLLDAAKAGDDRAFEIMLRPLLEPGYRLAGGMLQDHQAAQDAVQEAAFKAWRKLRQLRDPTPATTLNCFFQLTFEGTTYRQTFSATGGKQEAGQGNVVVKNNEIDFFNGVICGLKLPDGVGRYRWAITAGVLQFTLISDPCTRWEVYTHQGWTRALVAERILRGLDSRDLTSPVRANGGACTRTPQPAKRRRRY